MWNKNLVDSAMETFRKDLSKEIKEDSLWVIEKDNFFGMMKSLKTGKPHTNKDLTFQKALSW